MPAPSPPGRVRLCEWSWSAVTEYVSATVALGLVSGALRTLGWLYLIRQRNFVTWNVHMLWMPLVSEAVFMLALLLLMSPLAVLLRRRSFDSVLYGTSGTFAAFAILAAPGLLNFWAVLLLSLGMGVQLARLFREHSSRMRRMCRFTAPVGVMTVALIAGTLIGWRSLQERRALAGLAPAREKYPNVLFVVWDTVRADQMEIFQEGGAETPHLSQLARGGVAFERAIAPASWTLPSHTSMFTGQFPHEFSADWFTPIDQRQTMLAEVLRDRGYQTGGFVANTGYCGRGVGMDQGFLHYEDFKVNARQIGRCNLVYHLATRHWPRLSPSKTGEEITDDFRQWLERTSSERPFFAFLNYMDAHTPYLPEMIDGRPLTPSEIARMQAFEQLDPGDVSDSDRELALRCYRAQITNLDAQLGRLLDILRRRNALENTVVVVVADHGEHFGEHGLYFHGNSLYRPVVHVPLVIAGAEEIPHGERVKIPVSLRNMAATVLDCIGVREETPIGGRSLLKIAAEVDEEGDGHPRNRNPVYAHNSMEALKAHLHNQPLPFYEKSVGWEAPLHLWVDGEFFMIRRDEGETELYNVMSDPRQIQDLSRAEGNPSQLSRMTLQLEWFLDSDRIVQRD